MGTSWGATQTWELLGCSSSHSTSGAHQGPFLSGAFSLSCCREGQEQQTLGVAVVLCRASPAAGEGMDRKD